VANAEIPDDDAELAALLLARAKRGRLPDWAAAADLPEVRWAGGGGAPTLAIATLLRSKREEDRRLLPQIRERVDRSTMSRLVERLFELWAANDTARMQPWVFESLGRWGDEAAMRRLALQSRVWAKQGRSARVRAAADAFALHGGPTATSELGVLAESGGTASVRRHAADRLDEVAARRGLSREDLADEFAPDLGLSKDGTRVFDYGGRRFTLQLQPDLTLTLRDEQGGAVKGIPKPAKRDDPARAASAAAAIKDARSQWKETAARESARLERSMIAQRTLPLWRWMETHLTHPVLRMLAQHVVWTGLDATSQREKTFRVAEDWTLADENDLEVDAQAFCEVRLAHPLFWRDGLRDQWRGVFADYGISPLFDQIDRAVYPPPASERDERSVRRYCGVRVDNRILAGRLRRAGWRLGTPVLGPATFVCVRSFEEYDVAAVLHHGGVILGRRPEAFDVEVGELVFVRGAAARIPGNGVELRDRMRIGEVPSIVYSESMRDVAAAVHRKPAPGLPGE
jgi:hypothetical protein